jgi:hypothetical protein
VDAGPYGLHHQFAAGVRGRRDGHGVHPGVEHLSKAPVHGKPREIRGDVRAFLRRTRHHTGEFDAVGRLHEGGVEVPAAGSVADKSDAHARWSFCPGCFWAVLADEGRPGVEVAGTVPDRRKFPATPQRSGDSA